MAQLTQKEINTEKSWFRKHGSIKVVLQNHEKRITFLERNLRAKGKKYSPPEICDAPKCRKPVDFQCGENTSGKIGSWCSEKHFKKYAKS